MEEASSDLPCGWREGKAGTGEGYCSLRLEELMRWPEPNCPQDLPLLRKWSPLLTWQPIRKGSACLLAARENTLHTDTAQLGPQVHQDPMDPNPKQKWLNTCGEVGPGQPMAAFCL